ncbi:hypothetical protein [Paraburkholderia caribensis]|nr:hypothetical protein [Paraburkholderia caribensis]
MAAGVVAVIRIGAKWLATEPLKMRAGTDAILARVKVFGSAPASRLPVCQQEFNTHEGGLAYVV